MAIRAVGPEYASRALAILHEASLWLASRGLPGWSEAELQNAELASHGTSGALILGFADQEPVACMLLLRSDPIYWPRATHGSALYLHKLAVGRAHAGCGWGARMVAWAKSEAQRQGVRRVRLDTWEGSRVAALYSAEGFRLVDCMIGPDNGARMWRMECLVMPRLKSYSSTPTRSGQRLLR